MSIYTLLKGKRGKSGFGYASTAEEVTDGFDLSGKTVVLTGCNSGIGAETARVLAMRGAHIVGLARTLAKAEAALAPLGDEVTPVACELADPASVRAAVDTIAATGRQLDVLLCNAGIMALPKLEQSHGYELQFFTNHIGHFILVTGLLDQLAPDARVLMLSSDAHTLTYPGGVQFDNLSGEKFYWSWLAYGQAKLCNLLFARALADRFEGSDRIANAIHPGAINTNLVRNLPGYGKAVASAISGALLKNVHQGAATSCWAAVHPDAGRYNGMYFADCNLRRPSAHAGNRDLRRKLWEVSDDIVARV